MGMKHIYKIELEKAGMASEKVVEAVLDRLKQDGRKAELSKKGAPPVVNIDGSSYQLTVVSGASSGIGVPCAILKEL